MGGDDEEEEEEEETADPGAAAGPQDAEQKPIEIPPGCYDVGDGYYNPKEGKIYTYGGELMRQPSKDEADWITKSCTKNDIKFVNFNID